MASILKYVLYVLLFRHGRGEPDVECEYCGLHVLQRNYKRHRDKVRVKRILCLDFCMVDFYLDGIIL